jgi:hypothetical protein
MGLGPLQAAPSNFPPITNHHHLHFPTSSVKNLLFLLLPFHPSSLSLSPPQPQHPTDRPTAPNSSLAIPYRRPSYRFLRIFESGELPFAVSIPFALPQRCIVFEAIERYTSCPDGYEAIVWRGARDTAKSGVRRLACCWVLLLLLLLLLSIDALCLSPIHCR